MQYRKIIKPPDHITLMDYKEETKKAYNQHAGAFANKFLNLLEIHRRYEFKRFLELLNGKDILDIGCGGGDHSLFFKNQGLNVKAIDLSEEMIKICKQKDIDAEVMDLEDMSFKDNSFDGVWAVTSLLHVPKEKIDNVLRKISDILRPKGIFYICVKEGDEEGMVPDKNSDTKRFFAFWKEEELLNELKKYFEIIESKKVELRDRMFIQIFCRKT